MVLDSGGAIDRCFEHAHVVERIRELRVDTQHPAVLGGCVAGVRRWAVVNEGLANRRAFPLTVRGRASENTRVRGGHTVVNYPVLVMAKVRTARHNHRGAVVVAACLLAFAIVAVLLYLPTGPFDNSRLPGGGFYDPALTVWLLEWTPFALIHGHNPFWTTYINYPTGADLAKTNPAPLLGVFAAPLTILVGPVASYNFLLRLALFSSASSMFFILRTWCQRPWAAFLGGLLYGFGPYLSGQAHGNGAQLQLAFSPLLPVIIWCLYDLAIAQKRHSVRMGLLLGIFAGAQALIDIEMLVYLAILVFLYVGVLMLKSVAFGPAVNRPDAVRRVRYLGVGLGAAGGPFLLLSGDLLWWLLFSPGHLTGPVFPTSFLQAYSSDLLTPFMPTSNELLAPGSIARAADGFVANNDHENGGYLGIPLIATWMVTAIALRRDRIVRIATGLAAIAFVLSLGDRLMIDGHDTHVPLPEGILVHLPLLDNSMPARFGIDVALFASVALSVGLDHALGAPRFRHSGDPDRWRIAALVGLALATLATVAPRAPFRLSSFEWPATLDGDLTTIPSGAVVLTYPYPITDWDQTMLWQAQRRMAFRIVGGTAYYPGPNHTTHIWVPLSYPDYVQEFLVEEQFGHSEYYPPFSQAVGPTGDTALCLYLTKRSIDTVVWWDAGSGAAAVQQYFDGALGQPNLNDHGVLLIWRHASSVCR